VAVQRNFLPFELDLRFLLYKILLFLLSVLDLMGIYLRTRRLAPLMRGRLDDGYLPTLSF